MVNVPPPAPPAGPPPLTPPPNLVDKPGSQTPPSLAQQPAGPIVEVYPMGPPLTVDDLIIESRNSQILGDNLRAAGVEPPDSTYEPHHIVPSRAGGARMDAIRNLLADVGVGLNDAPNGTWVPSARSAEDAPGAYHPRLNNDVYNDAVIQELTGVTTKEQAINILADIAARLATGDFPGVRPRP
jgi:hypothetical protein